MRRFSGTAYWLFLGLVAIDAQCSFHPTESLIDRSLEPNLPSGLTNQDFSQPGALIDHRQDHPSAEWRAVDLSQQNYFDPSLISQNFDSLHHLPHQDLLGDAQFSDWMKERYRSQPVDYTDRTFSHLGIISDFYLHDHLGNQLPLTNFQVEHPSTSGIFASNPYPQHFDLPNVPSTPFYNHQEGQIEATNHRIEGMDHLMGYFHQIPPIVDSGHTSSGVQSTIHTQEDEFRPPSKFPELSRPGFLDKDRAIINPNNPPSFPINVEIPNEQTDGETPRVYRNKPTRSPANRSNPLFNPAMKNFQKKKIPRKLSIIDDRISSNLRESLKNFRPHILDSYYSGSSSMNNHEFNVGVDHSHPVPDVLERDLNIESQRSRAVLDPVEPAGSVGSTSHQDEERSHSHEPWNIHPIFIANTSGDHENLRITSKVFEAFRSCSFARSVDYNKSKLKEFINWAKSFPNEELILKNFQDIQVLSVYRRSDHSRTKTTSKDELEDDKSEAMSARRLRDKLYINSLTQLFNRRRLWVHYWQLKYKSEGTDEGLNLGPQLVRLGEVTFRDIAKLNPQNRLEKLLVTFLYYVDLAYTLLDGRLTSADLAQSGSSESKTNSSGSQTQSFAHKNIMNDAIDWFIELEGLEGKQLNEDLIMTHELATADDHEAQDQKIMELFKKKKDLITKMRVKAEIWHYFEFWMNHTTHPFGEKLRAFFSTELNLMKAILSDILCFSIRHFNQILSSRYPYFYSE